MHSALAPTSGAEYGQCGKNGKTGPEEREGDMVGLNDGAPTAAALLEAMSEAVYAVDDDRRITFWSPARNC